MRLALIAAVLFLCDRWGTDFTFLIWNDGRSYIIRSLGADKERDDTPPGEFSGFDEDIDYSDGKFITYPVGTQVQ